MKCRRPLAHNPQFEGKVSCKRCAEELRVFCAFIEEGVSVKEALALSNLGE